MEPLRGEDPRRIGRYTLVARLGSGGMGQVFLGFSPAGRPVAVKVVHPELARDQAFLTRFRQEVAAARKVSGAYTAAVVEARDGDRPWLATTLVVGPSLADAVAQRGPLPEVSVWRLAAGLAEALAEVHAGGLVHRDLKPSNVLLAADGPRVIDFGISRALDGTVLTETGMLVGTPEFMSPEQATGAPAGPPSDLFSFGGVLTFAATGSGPFGDGTSVAIVVVLATSSPGPAPNAAGGGTNPQPPGAFGAIPAETGTPHAGTLSFAQPQGSPTWILPIVSATNNTTANTDYFDYLMWRPLYWPGKGVSAQIDPALSLAKAPVWSGGDTTVTIAMNPGYKWSDGRPVSAEDVAFDIDLTKAAVKEKPQNWSAYNPGSFPDDLVSLSTPDQATLVLNLSAPVNPSWFYEDVLQDLQPMPSHAWAKAAANGPILDFTNPANAKKIYDYLAAQSSAMSTWAASPLWKVVDGPFRLASFNETSGAFTLAADTAYGGPSSHQIKAVDEVPFGTDAAMVKAVQTGSIDMSLIPNEDVSQVPRLRSSGYDVFGYPDFGYTDAIYNFKDTTGDFDHIVAQLYFRQAMAHLQNQQQYLQAFMGGAGSPAYGPIPPLPASQYTPGNAKNTYPFSLTGAENLLSSNGWKVVPHGIDTCVRPGSAAGQCGAGIPAGTRLAFNFVYDAGAFVTQEEVTALAAEARQAGIAITLVKSSFGDILASDNDPADPANADKWAMADYGWTTQGPYPTTFTAFNSTGSSNAGGYSDPQADALIDASISSSDPDAVRNEAAYLTTQQPVLVQPNADVVYAWKKTLSGPPLSFASLTQYLFTPELWYFTR